MSFFIESHAHIDYAWTQSGASGEDLISFARGFVARAQAAGVMALVNIGTNRHRTEQSYSLARAFPGVVFTTVGVHPEEAKDITESELLTLFSEWEGLFQIFPEGIVAVGECGLDYFYGPMTQEAKEHQKKLFLHHIEFADRL